MKTDLSDLNRIKLFNIVDMGLTFSAKIGSRLTVFGDDTGFIAADDQGRQNDYAHEG